MSVAHSTCHMLHYVIACKILSPSILYGHVWPLCGERAHVLGHDANHNVFLGVVFIEIQNVSLAKHLGLIAKGFSCFDSQPGWFWIPFLNDACFQHVLLWLSVVVIPACLTQNQSCLRFCGWPLRIVVIPTCVETNLPRFASNFLECILSMPTYLDRLSSLSWFGSSWIWI